MTDFCRFLPDTLKELVVVRLLGRGDVERMIHYFDSLGQGSRSFFHPHPFDRGNAERLCEDDSAEAFRIVAESEGRIVGYAWFAPANDCALPAAGIGIADDFQGKKLGGALMDMLSAEAKQRGLTGLRLTVYPDNTRAVRLYRSRGYTVVGESGGQHVMDLLLNE